MNNSPDEYLENIFRLRGKTVLVTGACGQLGKVICEAFLNTGVDVIGADLKLDQKKIINNDNINYFILDIASKKSVKNLFYNLYKKYNSIDILINNAGVSTFENFEDRSDESFAWVVDINLKGTFFCIQEYFNYQKKENIGNIINVASVYGLISPDPRIYSEGDRKNSEVYGATKAGVIQISKYFATHLAEKNFRVNAISPGGIFNQDEPQSKKFINEYSKRNPMGRMAKQEEIIGAMLYLASDASTYVTGHNLVIDGGMSCW